MPVERGYTVKSSLIMRILNVRHQKLVFQLKYPKHVHPVHNVNNKKCSQKVN